MAVQSGAPSRPAMGAGGATPFYLLLVLSSVCAELQVSVVSPQMATLGSDALLECIFTVGQASVTLKHLAVVWNLKGKDLLRFGNGLKVFDQRASINEAEIMAGNASLVLSNVTVADEGMYRCSVIYSPEREEKYLTLNLQAPPEITIPEQAVIKGKENFLRCSVVGFYPVEIDVSWLRDGQILPRTSTSKPQRFANGTFMINSTVPLVPTDSDASLNISCRVQHASLRGYLQKDTRLLFKEEKKGRNTAGVMVSLLVVMAIVGVLGWFLYERTGGEKAKPSPEEQDEKPTRRYPHIFPKKTSTLNSNPTDLCSPESSAPFSGTLQSEASGGAQEPSRASEREEPSVTPDHDEESDTSGRGQEPSRASEHKNPQLQKTMTRNLTCQVEAKNQAWLLNMKNAQLPETRTRNLTHQVEAKNQAGLLNMKNPQLPETRTRNLTCQVEAKNQVGLASEHEEPSTTKHQDKESDVSGGGQEPSRVSEHEKPSTTRDQDKESDMSGGDQEPSRTSEYEEPSTTRDQDRESDASGGGQEPSKASEHEEPSTTRDQDKESNMSGGDKEPSRAGF